MAATDFFMARSPLNTSDKSVKNTSGAAMTAWQTVKVDPANPMSASQPQVGVVLTSAITDVPYGITIENIPAGGIGRVQSVSGTEVQAIAAGAIAAGQIVGPSAVTPGQVTVHTAGDPSVGQALTASVNAGDPIQLKLMIANVS